MAERCPWVGPVTLNQCDKEKGHIGPHRPFPGIEETTRGEEE